MPPKKVIKNEPNIIIESDSDNEPKPIKKTTKKKVTIQEEPVIINQVNQDYDENLTELDFKEILNSCYLPEVFPPDF